MADALELHRFLRRTPELAQKFDLLVRLDLGMNIVRRDAIALLEHAAVSSPAPTPDGWEKRSLAEMVDWLITPNKLIEALQRDFDEVIEYLADRGITIPVKETR